MTSSTTKSLDVTGLLCPIPVLKAKKAIVEISPGEVLEVLATDPAAESDIPAWAQRAGHKLLETRREGNLFRFYVQRMK
ncbi:MAG: sulfurtransferase TusA family protein [Thaumarchaeota archaeon]|nr:sulfurtransferase TusA family protein [Nitrososphaerota archaeon]